MFVKVQEMHQKYRRSDIRGINPSAEIENRISSNLYGKGKDTVKTNKLLDLVGLFYCLL